MWHRGDHFFIQMRDKQRPNGELLVAPVTDPKDMQVRVQDSPHQHSCQEYVLHQGSPKEACYAPESSYSSASQWGVSHDVARYMSKWTDFPKTLKGFNLLIGVDGSADFCNRCTTLANAICLQC